MLCFSCFIDNKILVRILEFLCFSFSLRIRCGYFFGVSSVNIVKLIRFLRLVGGVGLVEEGGFDGFCFECRCRFVFLRY